MNSTIKRQKCSLKRCLLYTSNLDFQTLDVDKAAETEYLKALKLKELLKMNPAQYVENQLLNGAKEE